MRKRVWVQALLPTFRKLVSKTELLNLLEKRDLSVNLWEIIQLIDGKIELVGKERRS